MPTKLILICLLTGMVMHGAAQPRQLRPLPELYALLKTGKQDTIRVDLLLQVSEHFFFTPSRSGADLDSAQRYGQLAESLSTSLGYQKGIGDSWEQLSKVLHFKGDTVHARALANKAIGIYSANHLFLELGYAYYDLSGYYYIDDMNSLAERIRIVEQLSLPAFRQASKKKEADVLMELGDLLQIYGDLTKALSVLNQSLQIYQSIGYTNLEGLYNLLGQVYNLTGNYEPAIKYGLLAIKAAELVNDTSIVLATTYNRIGASYGRIKQPGPSYEYIEKALAVAEKYKDTATIIVLTCNSSRALIAMDRAMEAISSLKNIQKKYNIQDTALQTYVYGSLFRAYIHLKQYDKAQIYCDKLSIFSKSIYPNDVGQMEVQYTIAEFYLTTHQYDLARKQLESAAPYYRKTRNPIVLSKDNFLWFKLDSAKGNYISAISHYQRYKEIEDSALNETTRKNIQQLQIEFESEKKNRDIKLLEKEGRLQQEQLVQSNQTRNWTMGVALLLLLISGLIFYNSRLKQRTNKKLTAQQKEIEKKNLSLRNLVEEKEWLVKEIHHRVKNNFHMVIGLLGTQSGYLKTEEAIYAMNESQNRIYAMSLMHQKLYQSDDLTALNMSTYIHELVDHLKDAFNIGMAIQFRLNIEPIELDLAQCIPLGLILNEAITNAIKYAFPDDRGGIIEILLERLDEQDLRLVIADNGVGLPSGFNIKDAQTMGMRLMKGLSEDIDGKFSMVSDGGTRLILEFQLPVYEREDTHSGRSVRRS